MAGDLPPVPSSESRRSQIRDQLAKAQDAMKQAAWDAAINLQVVGIEAPIRFLDQVATNTARVLLTTSNEYKGSGLTEKQVAEIEAFKGRLSLIRDVICKELSVTNPTLFAEDAKRLEKADPAELFDYVLITMFPLKYGTEQVLRAADKKKIDAEIRAIKEQKGIFARQREQLQGEAVGLHASEMSFDILGGYSDLEEDLQKLEKAEFVTALLNQEAPWRRFCTIALQPELTVQTNNRERASIDNRAKTFTAGITSIDLLSREKGDSPNEPLSLTERGNLVRSMLRLMRYDEKIWTISSPDDGVLDARQIKRTGSTGTEIPVSYIRSRRFKIENDKLIHTETVTPRDSFAFIQLAEDGEIAKVNVFSEEDLEEHPDYIHEGNGRIEEKLRRTESSTRELAVLALLRSKGDISLATTSLERAGVFKDALDKKEQKAQIQALLANVASYTCVFLNGKSTKESSGKLHNKTVSQADRIKQEHPHFPRAISIGINELRSVTIAAASNHDIGDGTELNELLKQLLENIVTSFGIQEKTGFLTSDDLERQIEILGHGHEEFVPTQAQIMAEKVISNCEAIAAEVRRMRGLKNESGKLMYPTLQSTKFANPSLLFQYALAPLYAEIYSDVFGQEEKEIGILQGSGSISVDLDLIPEEIGIDLDELLQLIPTEGVAAVGPVNQAIERAQNAKKMQLFVQRIEDLQRRREASINNSSMKNIKIVGNATTNHRTQAVLTEVAKRLPLGYARLAGPAMMSCFSFTKENGRTAAEKQTERRNRKKQIVTSSPALAPVQHSAITVRESGVYLDEATGKIDRLMSIQIKTRDVQKSLQILKQLRARIESGNIRTKANTIAHTSKDIKRD